LNRAVSRFKADETHQPPSAFRNIEGLAEFTSRKGRQELALLTYDTIDRMIRIEKQQQRFNSEPIDRSYTANKVMAESLGVHINTIQRWRRGGYQSQNLNALKLIKLSLEHAPQKTLEILQKELDRHWREFYLLSADYETQQGASAFQKVEATAR
jgi:hypothetical protein